MINVVKLAEELEKSRTWTFEEKHATPQFCYDWIINKRRKFVGHNQDLALANLLFTTEFLAEVFCGWRDVDDVQDHYREKIEHRVVLYLEERYLNRFKQTSFCSWSVKMFREINEIKSVAKKKKLLIANSYSGTPHYVLINSSALKLWLSAWEELYRDFSNAILYSYLDKKNDSDFLRDNVVFYLRG